MTALSDVMHDTAIERPRTLDGGRWMMRGAQRFAGVAMVLAALGLWAVPGSQFDTDLMLIKLALSLVIGFAGLAVLQGGRAQPGAEVEIDVVRREVRLVRGPARARMLVSRTRMSDLGRADVVGAMIHLWDADGALIAEVAPGDPAVRASLIGALRDAGKL